MSKRTAILLLLSCCFFAKSLQAQNSSELEKSYKAYFEAPREIVHLHLNKTTYVVGEEIWFTAYMYDQKDGKPSLETKNLICGIYDINGKQIKKERFFVSEGIATGNFKINEKMGSGQFYIQASTNWMQNFKETSPFLRLITVLNEFEEQSTKQNNLNYYLAIQPEGGHLVANMANNIGFVLQDNEYKGIGIKTGYVDDSKGNRHISNIQDANGLGKFTLSPKQNINYTLTLELLNGAKVVQQLPNAEPMGITIAVNNILEDKISIELNTNQETLRQNYGNTYYLAIHRGGIITTIQYELTDAKKILFIEKENLLSGINILSLFDSKLELSSERIFYNHLNTKMGEVSVETSGVKKTKDSVIVELNLLSPKNTTTSLSISVLPEENLENDPNQSIFSSFLFQPYVKRKMEYPLAYFKSLDRKTYFKLDQLLLVQGKSIYDWMIIFDKTPKTEFSFEKGIDITGKVFNNTYGSEQKLGLFGSTLQGFKLVPIDNNRTFSIYDNVIYKNDSLAFTLVKPNGKLAAPEMEMEFSPKLKEDRLELMEVSGPFVQVIAIKNKTKEQENFIIPRNNDRIINLKNVTVTERKISKVPVQNPSLLKSGFFKAVKVTERDSKVYPLFKDLLRKLGFKVGYTSRAHLSEDTLSNIKVNLAFPDQPIILPKSPRGGSAQPPIVYLDDIKVVDLNIGMLVNNLPINLLETSTKYFDEVYYEHMGLDESNGGTLYIYMKYGRWGGQKRTKKIIATEGFKKPISYYDPNYDNYINSMYLKFGVVHWEGIVLSETSGKVQLKLPHFGLENVILLIEGMASDGTLFSEVKTINLN